MSAPRNRKPDPRKAHAAQYRALKARIGAQGLPCALCGRPIDYSLPQGHPWCYELDHKIPLSKIAPHLRERAALDPENAQPAHRWCNRQKSDKLATKPKDCSVGGSVGWLE